MRIVQFKCDWCGSDVEFEKLWELSLTRPSESGTSAVNTVDQICPNCYQALYMAVAPVERKRKGFEQ